MPVSGPVSKHDLDDLPLLMDLKEAAKAVSLSTDTLRAAIKAGELASFIPRGRDPGRAGRGMGYRIRREDLAAWYFGE